MNSAKCILCLLSLAALPLSADPVRVCLGVVDAAGLPPKSLPPMGTRLERKTPASPFTDTTGRPAGYLPAVYRDAVDGMKADGIRLLFEVRHHYRDPRPGRFLQIEIWAETDTPEQIRPLHYTLPVHLAGR